MLGLQSAQNFGDVLQSTSRSDIDVGDDAGMTALHYAALLGNVSQVKDLLRKGANPNNRKNCDRSNAVTWALCDRSCSLEMLNVLRDAGAGFEYEDVDGIYNVLLHCQPEILEFCMQFNGGLDRSTCTFDPFQVLAMPQPRLEPHRKAEVIRWLLQKGFNPRVVEDGQNLTMGMTVLWNNHQMLEELLRHYSHNLPPRQFANDLFIPILATAADVTTLRLILGAATEIDWTETAPEEWDSALDVAIFRRNNNEDWSLKYVMPADEDPQLWFETFHHLCKEVVKQHTMKAGNRIPRGELKPEPLEEEDDEPPTSLDKVMPGAFPKSS